MNAEGESACLDLNNAVIVEDRQWELAIFSNDGVEWPNEILCKEGFGCGGLRGHSKIFCSLGVVTISFSKRCQSTLIMLS